MQKTTLLFLLVLSCTCLKAQTNLDSLYTIWEDETQTDSIRVSAYKDYIQVGFLSSKPDSAFILAEALIVFGQEKQTLKAKAIGYHIQGLSFAYQSNYPQALAYYQRSLKIKEEIGDKKGIASLLIGIGNTYFNQGNYPQALDYYKRGLKINEELGNKHGISQSLQAIGNIYNTQSNYPKALDNYQRSLEIQEELGGKQGISQSLLTIGLVYRAQGNYPRALAYYLRSLKIKEEIGDKRGIAYLLTSIGNIYTEQDNADKGLDYYQRSLKIQEELGDKLGISISLYSIGNIYKVQSNYPQALDNYQRSLKISEEIGDKYGIALSLQDIGNIYFDQGNYPQATDYYQRGLKINEEIGDKYGTSQALSSIGLIYVEKGSYNDAIVVCQRSLALGEEIGSIDLQKEACSCLYEANKGLGKGNEALKYHEQMEVMEDSLKVTETVQKLSQMEFDKQNLLDSIATVKKEQQVELVHQEELRAEENTRNISFGIGGFFVLLAIGFFSRWRYVKKSKASLQVEKDRSENLLLNILPAEIAEELKEKGRADARDFEMVSVIFTDFKGFTQASAKLGAQELVAEINTCFEAFDEIMEKYGIEKIKTIGDAYMAAGGLPVPSDSSVKNTVLATMEMQAFISARKLEMDALDKPAFEMRVGIHTGPVVAGIVGVKKFQYDIWGDTVNTASRMESSGDVGKVNISQTTYELLKDDSDFTFKNRGKIEVKGKGEMDMYFVEKS
ncbi:MAG: class 3 adenylate cyclase/tetratricopeptide (TPR) repeat protein [Halioglobus sp.]|jgi:class 3 adenylate cyclase/tetratricopeptide (TPR) repeat protein